MTTSKQPWSTRPSTQGNGQGAEILDASGTVIGFFLDYRDAEVCVTEHSDQVDVLERQIASLENELQELEEKLEQ